MLAGDFLDVFLTGQAATVSRVVARTYLNNAQNQILGVDNSITQLTPFPYLKTVAGQYQYTVNGSLYNGAGTVPGAVLTVDVRNVREIIGSANVGAAQWPFPFWRNRREVWDGQMVIDCRESAVPGSNDCQINITQNYDPGDSTDVWVCSRAYRWPNQVVSDNTVLDTPEDFCLTLLYEAVKKMIERDQYGRADATETPYALAMRDFVNKYGNPVRTDTARWTKAFDGRRVGW